MSEVTHKIYWIDATRRKITEVNHPSDGNREQFNRLAAMVGEKMLVLAAQIGPTQQTGVFTAWQSSAPVGFSLAGQDKIFAGNAVVLGPSYRIGPLHRNANPELTVDEIRALVTWQTIDCQPE